MRIATILAVALLGTTSLAIAEHAQAAIQHYQLNIPRQSLDTALKDLAQQTGLQIGRFSARTDGGAMVGPVLGDQTPAQALKTLLHNTGLEYKIVSDTTIAVYNPKDTTGAQFDSPLRGSEEGAAGSTQSAFQNASGSSSDANTSKEAGKKTSQDFRVAQATSGQTSSTPAVEQNNARAPDSSALQEVVVTAQKRAETVNTTPIAVTAIDFSQLQNARVIEIPDLASNVPDLQVHTVDVDSYFGVTIRGVSNLTYTPNGNPAVSTYVDGVYVDVPVGLTNELFDLSRIEVLRGPQGTLYGRNSTGGNVNIVTADPKDTFGAEVDSSYGSYNDFLTHAMVNVPLFDTLSIRFALMQHRSDGYFDTLGSTNRNYGGADDFAGRVTALWRPTDSFTWRISLGADASRGTPGASIETGDDGMPLNGLSPYHQPVNPDPAPLNHIDNATVRSRMEWNLGSGVTLAYVAGYQDLRQYYDWATTGQVGAPAGITAYRDHSSISSMAQSHEIDASYASDKINNVLGATYFHDDVDQAYFAIFPIIALSGNLPKDEPWRTTKSGWGVFDQATYTAIDSLRLTGGVRYSHDSQNESSYTSIFCGLSSYPNLTVYQTQFLTATSPGCAAYPTPNGVGSWSKVTWKGGLEYDVNKSTLTYASATTGYKQGGVQPGLPALFPTTYQPEQVTNYEVGVKTRLLDNSLNVRVAAFYEDYTNIQTFQLISIAGFLGTATTNAGAARIHGTEVETDWNLTPIDHLSGFLTYLHARYTNFSNAVNPLNANSTIPSLAGNQLPNAPEVSVRVQLGHDFRLTNGGSISPEVASYWQSTSYTNAYNVDVYKVPTYSKTSVRLTYVDPSLRWNVSAYIDNLENHAVRTGNYTGSGIVFSDFAPPRTYGLRVSFTY